MPIFSLSKMNIKQFLLLTIIVRSNNCSIVIVGTYHDKYLDTFADSLTHLYTVFNTDIDTVKSMLNKNSLAIKKVRGQSEATMVISDQKL